MDVKKRILVIDGKNVMMQMMHHGSANPLWDFIPFCHLTCRDLNIDKVIICNDRGGSAYRLGIQPGIISDHVTDKSILLDNVHYDELPYKGDRRVTQAKRLERDPKACDTERKYIDKINDVVANKAKLFGFVDATCTNIEADDVISYLTRNGNSDKFMFAVVSSDCDILQLIKDNVVQRSYSEQMRFKPTDIKLPAKVWVNEKRFGDAYELTPREYVTFKAVAGDTGDSVYSPKGMGEKRAMALVQQYRTIEEIRANVGNITIPRFPVKLKQELIDENLAYYERNLKLVNLLHSPEEEAEIFGDKIEFLDSILDELAEPPNIDHEAIQDIMLADGKTGLASNYNEWIKVFE